MATGGEEAHSAPATDPLKYQTWVLKVSIHCQGCKREVRKVLRSIEGVYDVSADLKQQKVTVVGNVDAETLIKKLQKAGRRAEPWPEKPNKKEKDGGNKENPNSSNKDNGSGKDAKGSGKPKEKDPGAGEGGEAKPAEESSSSTPTASKPAAKSADAQPKAAGNASTEKAPAPKGGGTTPPPQEKPAAGDGAAEGDKPSGSGGKKGKKGQKEGGGVGSGGEASGSSGDAASAGMMHSHFPVYHHTPPIYAVSYSTAYPSASYGASYYAALPAAQPQQSHVHAARPQQHYTGYYYLPPVGVFIPPSDEEGPYDVFSDENANACRVM